MGFERLFENFENVEKAEECELIGSVPSWLKGTMVRNGPGMFKIGDTEYRHWFDGMAYIQRYHFVDGKVGDMLEPKMRRKRNAPACRCTTRLDTWKVTTIRIT
ncbi:hypothetical protein ANCDUO_16042 [Ancylostoma duodenale]|uniref:Uncharacterized protein n=1 Tax=Ancylostoma duodenale TaxID=51022 RepID=A0A0C2GA43_9BILA|nr:hypothetical protein ANCDUO_16042 [Ancylostoma duodenale]